MDAEHPALNVARVKKASPDMVMGYPASVQDRIRALEARALAAEAERDRLRAAVRAVRAAPGRLWLDAAKVREGIHAHLTPADLSALEVTDAR